MISGGERSTIDKLLDSQLPQDAAAAALWRSAIADAIRPPCVCSSPLCCRDAVHSNVGFPELRTSLDDPMEPLGQDLPPSAPGAT